MVLTIARSAVIEIDWKVKLETDSLLANRFKLASNIGSGSCSRFPLPRFLLAFRDPRFPSSVFPSALPAFRKVVFVLAAPWLYSIRLGGICSQWHPIPWLASGSVSTDINM